MQCKMLCPLSPASTSISTSRSDRGELLRPKIVGQFEIPAVYYFREEAAEGGLLAYAAREKSEAIRRARKLARKQAIREGLNFVRLECCPALHDMPSLYVGPAHVLGDDATHRRCT